jgi:hypothetical protein
MHAKFFRSGIRLHFKHWKRICQQVWSRCFHEKTASIGIGGRGQLRCRGNGKEETKQQRIDYQDSMFVEKL